MSNKWERGYGSLKAEVNPAFGGSGRSSQILTKKHSQSGNCLHCIVRTLMRSELLLNGLVALKALSFRLLYQWI
jgi:hypothetical protein